jgi:NitT/TauT family transport system substrate-binding protein
VFWRPIIAALIPLAYVRIVCVGLLIFVCLAFAGCSSGTPEERLRVGMVTFPGYAPFYLAKEKKLFGEVDIDLIRIESISDLRAAMKARKIDAYLATYDIFQSAANEEPPGIAVLAVDESHGADGIAADASIKSVRDLKGTRVAAEPGFPPYFALQYLLHKEGLTLKDIQFVDLASQDAGSAFAAGRYSAVGTYEPYLSKAIAQRKGAHLLASSRDLPNLIVDFVFVDEGVLKSRPATLRALAKGWFSALEYINKHPDEAAEIMARAYNISASEMKDFQSSLTWLDLARNQALFDKTAKNNAYDTFELVGTILDANGARQVKTRSIERLDDSVVAAVGR